MKYFWLTNAVILEVGGRDAQRYLNARLTNNIRTLSAGSCVLAAALTPQGRTEALFSVIHSAPGAYLLVADGGDPDSVIAAFKRYIVADRVDVLDRSSQWGALHIIPESAEDRALFPAHGVGVFGGGCAAPRRRSSSEGFDLIGSREQLAAAVSEAIEVNEEYARLLRLQAGIPAFPEELNLEHLFSESGLSEAVSYSKGCYVGQEVVEKIDSHGKTAKVLRKILIHSEAPVAVGAVVSTLEGEQIGEVLSAVFDPSVGGWLAFCSLKNRTYGELRVAETGKANPA